LVPIIKPSVPVCAKSVLSPNLINLSVPLSDNTIESEAPIVMVEVAAPCRTIFPFPKSILSLVELMSKLVVSNSKLSVDIVRVELAN